MDKTNDEFINNNENNIEINTDSVDNQMNTSFGKKRFFNRKNNSEPNDTNVSKIEGKKSGNKWSNSSLNTNNNNSNGFNTELNEEKFSGDGIQFGGKLIGHEFVAEARGEQMCQQSIKKLKILQRGLGGHKRKLHIFVSFDGIKIRDATTSELVYHHSVPQISFISRDETDSRAFGYVFGSTTTGHQFIAIKTQKEAMPVMSAIGQLFAATLKRKKNEIIEESVVRENDAINNVNNEEKSRRESSITLRPSRSESPNVPTMPAPPPPPPTTAPVAEEQDFFSSFDPIDSVFENDWKVDKEKLDQMPITGEGIVADPFASSFGSMSISSADWANFDDTNLSSNASPLQQSHNSFGNSLTNNGFSIPIARDLPKTQLSSSFSDSSNSMALNELFSSGNHNQQNAFPEFKIANSEAMAIPPRVQPNHSVNPPKNQSVSSTTSSSDRYACFAEIHSISSSIFDSLCDQIAAENSVNNSDNVNSSKSLNSSLNGGFGLQHQLSSSYNSSVEKNYFSFDNPLNNPNNTMNNRINAQMPDLFDSNQSNNEFNAQNWNNTNAINSNNSNTMSSVWSTSSSEKSMANSQWSGPSSPPHTTKSFAMIRTNDTFNELPVFAELDPLGKDKPFVDKTLFFADQKQKPMLRDLNSEFSSNSGSTGSDSPTIAEQNQIPSVLSSSRRITSNVNPFNDNKDVKRDVERCSPNPFNPFNICESNSRPTPPPHTPPPPPRPPSRDCPPVPPRNDLIKESAPPLPRRRTIIEIKSNVESQPSMPYKSVDPFANISYNTINNCSPPPIPNPQRKPQRKMSSNWDPFNCSSIENQLSTIGVSSGVIKVFNDFSDNDLKSSTPKNPTDVKHTVRPDLKLSEICSPYNWSDSNISVESKADTSAETPVFGSDKSVETHESLNVLNDSLINSNTSNTNEDRDNHISPPERNIFIIKSDPFEDEFFAN